MDKTLSIEIRYQDDELGSRRFWDGDTAVSGVRRDRLRSWQKRGVSISCLLCGATPGSRLCIWWGGIVGHLVEASGEKIRARPHLYVATREESARPQTDQALEQLDTLLL